MCILYNFFFFKMLNVCSTLIFFLRVFQCQPCSTSYIHTLKGLRSVSSITFLTFLTPNNNNT